jgi:hypothetical protein
VNESARDPVEESMAGMDGETWAAAIQRWTQALTAGLLTLTTSKQGPKTKPSTRALSNDSTKNATRAS